MRGNKTVLWLVGWCPLSTQTNVDQQTEWLLHAEVGYVIIVGEFQTTTFNVCFGSKGGPKEDENGSPNDSEKLVSKAIKYSV